MARAQATTDHQVIRRWIESHNGHPSVVRATEGQRKGSAGLLRVDFDEPEDALEEISWDDFFDTFDSNNLAFLYQEEKQSRFHKFVNRDSVDEAGQGNSLGAESTGSSKSSAKTRQASPAEQEEAEEIDEEDLEEEEEANYDEDESDEDYDEDIEEEDEDEDEGPQRGSKR